MIPENEADRVILDHMEGFILPFDGKLLLYMKNEQGTFDRARVLPNNLHVFDDASNQWKPIETYHRYAKGI